jgi:hypothetical protein
MSTDRSVCHLCKCVSYPSCQLGEEACEECLEAGTGYHLKIDAQGNRIDENTPDHYVECSNCSKHIDPDKLINGVCQKCISDACDKCGDITDNCDCYQ